MRLRTRLNVIDGKVLCPHTCDWKEIGTCAACTELRQIEHGAGGDTVVCDPVINRRLDDVLYDMIRTGGPAV